MKPDTGSELKLNVGSWSNLPRHAGSGGECEVEQQEREERDGTAAVDFVDYFRLEGDDTSIDILSKTIEVM